MKPGRYLFAAAILVVVLGLFLAAGTIASRRAMMALIKDEARSVLSIVALAQENSIFAEQRLEDAVIDELFGVVNYLEQSGRGQRELDAIARSFNLTSVTIVRRSDGRVVMRTGTPFGDADSAIRASDNIDYEYFNFRDAVYLRFVCRLGEYLYQIELPARDIRQFRQDYGINKILNQISANPLIKYLVLQDRAGIIFATNNLKTLSRIEGDSLLESVFSKGGEGTRIVVFEGRSILEIAQPFIVAGAVVGIFRIGINLNSYFQHTRKTLIELSITFFTLLVLGFFLFYLSAKYRSYLDLEELFSRTLSGIDEGIIMVDRTGRITGVNNAFCALSGRDERALLNHDYIETFRDDILSIRRVMESRLRIEEEKELFNRRVQYISTPVFKKSGPASGVIAVIRDVTRIREFEKEQKESERLSFLGNLVANFAHEIRNPLNGLSIAAQRLAREFPSEQPDYRNLTGTLLKEIGALNRVLNDFLGLVRPHAREKEIFNLGQVLTDALNIVREQLREKDIALVEELKDHVEMAGYPDDLKRAFLNILVNSVDAVLAARGRRGEVGVRLRAGREIVVELWDNGIGIDAGEIDRVFTPYFTTKKGGTGLGLFIAHKIVRDHGGKVTINSEKGNGTKFEITFPSTGSTNLT